VGDPGESSASIAKSDTASVSRKSTVRRENRRQICPERNVRNEKAPEIFNNFRGLVLFNNGGEIGTFRIIPYSPLKPMVTGTKSHFATNFCYKFTEKYATFSALKHTVQGRKWQAKT
jgi:hypothetical protein